ncbi:PilZ domain-containing protein [Noviherbaspirillum galbum]|uniref:PilZ domain-containing protein n=1 Tax=Noviherbaspirillum galbum TaxID=2709383 RepID=A0A6B3SN11_9BURK|nr:PilZ domain-containing protein [Noviherbaspirillum galbum]NEX60725.1 PilZ domain-containing protein [Noviherbaspirillum galbum]
MSSETRVYPRKALRCPALIVLPGIAPIRAKTVDVSLGGLSLVLPGQLPAGQPCTLVFEPIINGKPRRITAAIRVIYSILSSTDGFRTGVQFVELDAENNKSLAELMI